MTFLCPCCIAGLEYLARLFVAIECKLLSLTFFLKWTIRECYSRDQDNSSPHIHLIVKQIIYLYYFVAYSSNTMLILSTLGLIVTLIPGGEGRVRSVRKPASNCFTYFIELFCIWQPHPPCANC